MASRYSRKDGAQENNMIIDFEQYKREHAPEAMQSAQELEALEGLNSAFSNFLGTFSTNGMMMDIHTRVGERFSRLQLMEIISERASDAIAKAGFDPDRFRIDPPVFERFLSREIETVESVGDETWDIPPEIYWNGPYYDARLDGDLVRAATTVMMHEDGTTELLVDLVKLGEDKHWLMWRDGVWETDDFLEAVEEELRQRQIERLGPSALGYDEWESPIDSMLLSPGTVTVLHEAGIHTIDELKGMTDEELLQIRGIGKARVAEIREALEYED